MKNLPNRITLSRILLIFVFVALANIRSDSVGFFIPTVSPESAQVCHIIAYIVAILAAFTDMLDGYLARRFHLESDFGRLVDPLADKIFVVGTFVMMAEYKLMPGWIIIVVLTREFMVTGLRMLATHKGVVISADKWGKLKTILQMISLLIGGAAWVQMFDSEYEAFKTYCELYPTNATLLVDTYNTLKSGVPNAIRVFKEVLWPKGIKKCAIRLDSGDIAYLSKKARKMLDDAGLTECKIVASNSLDEDIILALIRQGAAVDAFGVGERMITAKSAPVFGGVYKLCAREAPDGTIIPKIKISENAAKITNPHYKKVYRLYDKENGKAIADYIAVHDEVVDGSAPIELFDPDYTWKRKTVTDYTVRELQVPIFLGGKCVYKSPSTTEIRDYCAKEVETLWDEVKRFENPHNYYVDLSQRLWDIKHELLKQGNK